MINKSDKIYIAGHRGMVGSACQRALESKGYTNLVGKTSKELDLREEHSYNVGTGVDLTIKELARIIQLAVGHKGQIVWDKSKPDGTPRKLMDISKSNILGWHSTIDLGSGIKEVYNVFESINSQNEHYQRQ